MDGIKMDSDFLSMSFISNRLARILIKQSQRHPYILRRFYKLDEPRMWMGWKPVIVAPEDHELFMVKLA